MIDLDNLNEIKKYDPKDVLGSTRLFVSQCRQIYQLIQDFTIPAEYQQIDNIVFAGMGGSALGAQVVYHLFKDQLKVPLYINNDYNLPDFVNKDTLVILSSYSGSTEEVLSCFEEAKIKKAKILGISTGGKLAEVLKKDRQPMIVFNPSNNPSGQPRLGIGYSITAAMMILHKAGVLSLNKEELFAAFDYIEKVASEIEQEAKKEVQQFYGKIPLIIAGPFLEGCAHILRNQFNETAKSFAVFSPIPELNHHLMEGLKNPVDKKLIALMLDSNLYSEKIQKRVLLTEDIIIKNKIPILKSQPQGLDKISQVLEVLVYGGFLTFYLAILYKQDPSLVPWVDYFKQKLS